MRSTSTFMCRTSSGWRSAFMRISIAAMLSHYQHDKQFIYGLDIRTLDALKESKANGRKS